MPIKNRTGRMKRRTTIVGVFRDQSSTQAAIRDLHSAGFTDDEIGVIARDDSTTSGTKKRSRGKDTEKTAAHAGEGALAGAAIGAGAGALWTLGIATIGLPALGPVIAGGWLAAALASAAGAATAGGLIGALVGTGISEDEAGWYESEFKEGRTIVTVAAEAGRTDEAWAILSRHGAYNRTTRTEAVATADTATATDGGKTVEVREEEMTPHKQTVRKGSVRVRKEVKTENRTIEVPVEREEVVVERRPVRRGSNRTPAAESEEIRIPVKEEEVFVEKRPVVKEEVRVSKRKVQGTQRVSGTVRKEEVHVEPEGDVEVTTEGTTTRRGRR